MDAAGDQVADLGQDKKRWRHSAGFRPAAVAVLEFFGVGDGAMAGEGGATPQGEIREPVDIHEERTKPLGAMTGRAADDRR